MLMMIDLFCVFFRGFFKKNGYEVVSAESGQMAKEEISRRVFDATLIDVRLPDVKGSELLSIVKERSPETLKIIFTGAPTNELVSGFNVQDLDAFFVKPVRPDILLDFLAKKFDQCSDS